MLEESRTKVDLELTSTEELLAELLHRYDTAYFVGTKHLEEDSHGISYAIRGDALKRMGLNDWVRITTFREFTNE